MWIVIHVDMHFVSLYIVITCYVLRQGSVVEQFHRLVFTLINVFEIKEKMRSRGL